MDGRSMMAVREVARPVRISAPPACWREPGDGCARMGSGGGVAGRVWKAAMSESPITTVAGGAEVPIERVSRARTAPARGDRLAGAEGARGGEGARAAV